jgi:hypothetical protein
LVLLGVIFHHSQLVAARLEPNDIAYLQSPSLAVGFKGFWLRLDAVALWWTCPRYFIAASEPFTRSMPDLLDHLPFRMGLL